MKSKRMMLCMLVLIGRVSFPVVHAKDVLDVKELMDMSFEELLNVEIISASRQEQNAADVAVPVGVLTAEEIHLSGVTNIPEALQLIPGMDVRRMDRTRYIVGVRGLFSFSSDRTLVLINGRDALNPAISAPDWLNLPVLLEDIQRIEVVRGPGGAAWGANAYTGVINIITKKPEDTDSLVQANLNHFGDVTSHVRASGKKGICAWRASLGYQDIENSDQAGAGEMVSMLPAQVPTYLIGFSNYRPRDFARVWRFDSEAAFQLNDQSHLDLGLAQSNSENGDWELVGYYPQRDTDTQHTRFFSKWTQSHNENANTTVQWYANDYRSHMPQIMSYYNYLQNDVEVRHDTQPHPDHQISLGANVRTLHFESRNDVLPGEMDYPDQANELWSGLSVADHYQANSRWSFEGQGRLDYYSESEWDWSGRLAAIRVLDAAEAHRLRWGLARAFRTPGMVLRETTLTAVGGLFNIVPNRSTLKNETTYAVELGYLGQWTPWMNVHVNTYYQRLDDVLGTVMEPAGPATNSYFANIDGADTYGVELENVMQWSWGHVRLWYNYHEVEQDVGSQSFRALKPARHKAGILGLWRLTDEWKGAVNYVYNDRICPMEGEMRVLPRQDIHRLDLTLSRVFARSHSEIMVGVLDVLNKTRGASFDVSNFSGYSTPGQTWFVRGQFSF